MQRTSFIILACFLASTPAAAQTLSGQWCGTAQQTGPGDHRSQWDAVVELKGAVGTTEYPSLGCGGTLSFERREGNVHWYREKIRYGRGDCLDGGLLGIEPQGLSVRFQWTGSDANASGVLHPHCKTSPNAALTRRARS
jgi:hypothetical protein